jgi:hypothetical protein
MKTGGFSAALRILKLFRQIQIPLNLRNLLCLLK